MEEVAVLEVAFPRVVSEHQTVELSQVLVPIHGGAGEALRQGGDLLLDAAAPVLGIGVRGEPLRDPAAPLRLTHAGEHLEDVRHFPGIVVHPTHVAQAEIIGLALVVARVFEKQHAEGLSRETAVAPELGASDRADNEAHLRELLFCQLARRMPGGDVPDLMAHHTGKLRLGVQVGEDAARDIDEATGEREGVDHGIVDHAKRPRQIGTLRAGREPRAKLLDVALEPRIPVDPDRRGDLLVVVAPQRDLLRLTDEHQLPRAGGGIDGAARGESGERGQPGEMSHSGKIPLYELPPALRPVLWCDA